LSAFTWPPDAPGRSTGQPLQRAEQVAAAVLVPLFIAGEPGEAHVVLTRRRADLRRHAGEISFPGGRRDAEDSDLGETALREAEEEIGLQRAQVDLLGTLPLTSTFVTNYVIHPFVAQIPAGVAWRLSPREVDAVLELPLEQLRAGRTRTSMTRRGITFETDAYVVGENLIWGATARILEDLFAQLEVDEAGAALRLAVAPAGQTAGDGA
jgi:8-oxo-dGTP pyrophosphatase MutT (NUDIX family)